MARGVDAPTILLSIEPPRRLSIRRFDCGSKAGAMQPGSECKDGSWVFPIIGFRVVLTTAFQRIWLVTKGYVRC